MDRLNWIRPDIVEMEPYVPIVPFEVLSKRLGRDAADIVKLDANENPYGPSPRVLEALANGRFYHIYPDPEANALRDALSDFVGVPQARLMAGMGADELIDLVLRVVLQPGEVVVDCPPTFGMYPFSTAVNAGRYVAVPRHEDFSLDVEPLKSRADPSGQSPVPLLPQQPGRQPHRRRHAAPPAAPAHPRHSGRSLCGICSGRWLPQPYPVGRTVDNLAVLRTFSKLAGLAGLRVGYGAFPDWLLPHMWKIKQPYNVNVAASNAALAALEDMIGYTKRLG
jgi:histidinol-phosphate aminotransferase